MDNFMDKLAQRFSAQDMIKANTQAEEAERRRLQEQVREYDECLKEMRELNLKMIEENDRFQKLMEQAVERIQNADQVQKVADAALGKIEEVKVKDQQEQIDLLRQIGEELKAEHDAAEKAYARIEDSTHKECVKVFRNVQVIVADETKKQADLVSEKMDASTKQMTKGKTPILVLLVIAILIGGANLAASILQLLGISISLY